MALGRLPGVLQHDTRVAPAVGRNGGPAGACLVRHSDEAALQLRIASFNLESLDDRAGGRPSLSRRIATLQPLLARLDADVICLQEVNAQKAGHGPRQFRALDRLLEGTTYQSFHRVSTTRKAGDGPLDVHNLVILSRFPVPRHRQLRHDLVGKPGYRMATAKPPSHRTGALEWDRPLLHAEIDIGGKRPLHVVNLHLRAPLASPVPGQKTGPFTWSSAAGWAEGFFIAAVKRTGQALEARLLADAIFDADPQALIAVCGDYNAEAAEMPTRIIRADPADMGNPALAGRRLLPLEDKVARQRRFSVRHDGRPLMLDHILVSGPLAERCREAGIDNRGLPDEAADDAAIRHYAGSFHAPVWAAFELPPSAAVSAPAADC